MSQLHMRPIKPNMQANSIAALLQRSAVQENHYANHLVLRETWISVICVCLYSKTKKKDYELIKTFLGTFLLSSKVWLTWRARELSRNHTFQSLCSYYRTVCHDLRMSFSNRSLLCYYMKQRRIANWQTNPHWLPTTLQIYSQNKYI